MIKLVGECEALGYDLLCYWGWIFYESNFMCGSKGLVFKAGIANVQGFPLCCSPEVCGKEPLRPPHMLRQSKPGLRLVVAIAMFAPTSILASMMKAM